MPLKIRLKAVPGQRCRERQSFERLTNIGTQRRPLTKENQTCVPRDLLEPDCHESSLVSSQSRELCGARFEEQHQRIDQYGFGTIAEGSTGDGVEYGLRAPTSWQSTVDVVTSVPWIVGVRSTSISRPPGRGAW